MNVAINKIELFLHVSWVECGVVKKWRGNVCGVI